MSAAMAQTSHIRPPHTTLHATAVAFATEDGFAGVLLRGPSGSGKSDLALRLIDGGARLIADDRTIVSPHRGVLRLSVPETIAGRLEVRGLGIVPLEHVDDVPLALIVDLVDADRIERLPLPKSEEISGVCVPVVALAPFEISAPAKVRLAVRAVACGILDRLD